MNSKLLILWIVFAVTPAFADAPRITIKQMSRSLDTSLRGMNVKNLVNELSQAVKLQPAQVKALLVETKHKLSALAIACFISEKTKKPVEEVLCAKFDSCMALQEANLSLTDAIEYLDNVSTEVAFALLDEREKHPRATATVVGVEIAPK